MFEVPDNTETRLWQQDMNNPYELMEDLKQTIYDLGIYAGQV